MALGIDSVIDRLLTDLPAVVRMIIDSPAGVLNIVGLILVVCACLMSYSAMKADGEASLFKRMLILLMFFLSVPCFVAGSGLSVLAPKAEASAVPLSKDESIEALKNNSEVKRLVRFVVWNSSNREIALHRLSNLGPENQMFTFVGDYDEVKGKQVLQAANESGLNARMGDHISVVIFPLRDGRKIYPANARGLLQVIGFVQGNKTLEFPFDLKKELGSGLNDLRSDSVDSYKWNRYSHLYGSYCAAARKFKCDKEVSYSEQLFIGRVTRDWHPLGFARTSHESDICDAHNPPECRMADWSSAALRKDYGVRVFLTANAPLTSLAGRLVLDYDEPARQRIPVLAD